MKDWYGPPIAVGGVPGEVYATRGGDFVGPVAGGQEASAFDLARDLMRRLRTAARIAAHPQRRLQLHTGFASLSALLDAAHMKGARQDFTFILPSPGSGSTGAGHCNSYWNAPTTASIPPPGTNASAVAAGRVPVGGTDGGFKFSNAPSGRTYFGGGSLVATGAASTLGLGAGNLLLYDRLFDVAKTASSTATEAVTGVPTRYQSQTAADPDYIGGNYLFIENVSGSAIAHNWTVCTYTDQAGHSSTLPSITSLNVAAPFIDLPLWNWFAPLEAGDVGVGALTQMQCSASVSGNINFVIGHPLAWFPAPVFGLVADIGGINSAFNLVRIFDGACLSLSDMRGSSGQVNWAGSFWTVAG